MIRRAMSSLYGWENAESSSRQPMPLRWQQFFNPISWHTARPINTKAVIDLTIGESWSIALKADSSYDLAPIGQTKGAMIDLTAEGPVGQNVGAIIDLTAAEEDAEDSVTTIILPISR